MKESVYGAVKKVKVHKSKRRQLICLDFGRRSLCKGSNVSSVNEKFLADEICVTERVNFGAEIKDQHW